MSDRRVTIVVHVDGELHTRRYRLPVWAFEAGKWAAGLVAVLVVTFFAFAGPIASTAARVPTLEREVARLSQDNARVQQLAAALNRAEANYQELRALLGARAPAADARPVELMRAAALRARTDTAAAPPAPPAGSGPSVPSRWPLDVPGFVTRGESGPGNPSESHQGIDIAVPEGTPVRAAGGGRVEAASIDRDYGLFVLLRHPEGYETMYGHAARLLVREGEQVGAGQVIAVSGSTGRSTAPHLHFEVRRAGRSIDPRTIVKEGN